MAQTIAKTATIKGTNLNDTTVELEMPLAMQKLNWTNNLNSFAKPNEQPPQRRTLNLNRIELARQPTLSVTDDFVNKLHNGTGDRPDISNKEQWLDELYKLYIAQNILTIEVTNDNTERSGGDTMPHAKTEGYLRNADITEKAGQDNSVYEITLKMIDEVPMNS